MDTRRRATSRKYSYKSREKKETDIREKILVQCIVSSVILATALTVCFIKTETTQNLKDSLKVALSTEVSREDLLKQVDSLKTSVKDIFGDKEKDTILKKPEVNTEYIENENENKNKIESTENRIDDEILEKINGGIENYEKKNSMLDNSD